MSHTKSCRDELLQASAFGSRLYAPKFLLASIVLKRNDDVGLRRKVTILGATRQ